MIDIWDLTDRTHEPHLTVSAAAAAVTSIEFHMASNRQLLAIGDDQGTVHVMEVPRNLRRATSNERQLAQSFFLREQQRVEWVQSRSALRAEHAEAGELPS